MVDAGRPWRVFLSHTGDLSQWPEARSWVSAAEDAVKRLRHAPVDMRYFTADDRPPADLCVSLLSGCDLYIGIIGPRYGSPVRGDPSRSYTELEFDTATALGKKRLIYMIGDQVAPGGPPDPWADRQERFRQRLLDSGVTVSAVAHPGDLNAGIVQAIAQMMLDAAAASQTAAARAPVAPRVPRQLPAEAAAFTDRIAYFDRLSDLLVSRDERRAPVGIVSGAPGVGKTSFAVHVAHRVRDRFPDGQLYVDLRGYSASEPLTPEEAIDGFLRVLGTEPERIPVDLAGRVELYRSTLDGRQVLVILDNAVTVEQVRPLLAPPAGATVITTRGPLSGLVVHDGATRMTLEPLEPIHAEALGPVPATGARGRPGGRLSHRTTAPPPRRPSAPAGWTGVRAREPGRRCCPVEPAPRRPGAACGR